MNRDNEVGGRAGKSFPNAREAINLVGRSVFTFIIYGDELEIENCVKWQNDHK